MHNAALIIVTHNPTEENLKHIRAISEWAEGVVVDNTPSIPRAERLSADEQNTPPCTWAGGLHHIRNGQNLGIAKAQNIGIEALDGLGIRPEYIIFLDQDSEITPQYVAGIIAEHKRLSAIFPNLAILGPTVIDKTTQRQYKSIHKGDNLSDRGFTRRREIISSGSCVKLSTLRSIGLFREELFIDYVDFELCWRAAAQGYVSGITDRVTLPHHVGQTEVRLFGYQFIISAPFRYYYQYRNHITLSRLPHTPRKWLVTKGVKLLLQTILFPFVTPNWTGIEKNMLRGFWHGLTKKDMKI